MNLTSLKGIPIAILYVLFGIQVYASDDIVYLQKISSWENVTGFDINAAGDYMVVSMMINNREQLFESRFDGTIWAYPTPIESINSFNGNTSNIGGPYLYFNENIIYYHANFPGGKGGYDIYYSIKTEGKWSEPIPVGSPISSERDEFHPSVPPGLQKFYFSRDNPSTEVKKPSRSPNCEIFYLSQMQSSKEWGAPKPLHDVVNIGCQRGLYVNNDGRTIFFSCVDQENHKEGYNIYFARELLPGSWLLPVAIEGITSEKSNLNPRIVDDYIYFIVQTESRKETIANIYRTQLPNQYKPLELVETQGTILHLESKKPLHSPLTVFDPITLSVQGEFYSDKQTGEYKMLLLDDSNYIVDVRNQGYSFAGYQIDYRKDEKVTSPPVIELFDEIDLDILVYDSEIFRPLDATVWVDVLSDNNRRIDAVNKGEGIYSLKLPVGHNYKISSTAKGFEDNGFEFNLFGDIIFSQFERNLPLDPKKKLFEIYVTDNETNNPINAEVTFKNLNRDEVISFIADVEAEEPAEAQVFDDMSDLMKIPFKNPTNPYSFALIIGNEDYNSYQVGLQSEANVDYAIRDANLFKEYAQSVLGVPTENIMLMLNARAIEMDSEIKRLTNIIKSLEGKAEVFVYYAGHGFPDPQTRDPYIIPVDVSGSSLRYGVKLTDLYSRLSEYPAKRVTVFLDACFSGGARNVGLVSARAIRVKPKEGLVQGNLVVFSATSENQTAHPYRDEEHGLFTYYLIRKIRETRGNITYKELSDYLKETVAIRSILVNNAEQSPQINVSPSVESHWVDWKLR